MLTLPGGGEAELRAAGAREPLPGAYRLEGMRPGWCARPGTPEQAGALLALAHRHGLAVLPWGGGTHMHLASPPARFDLALDLGGLHALVEYRPGDLVVAAQAGMTLSALQARLARSGQRLLLEASRPELATLGGLFASDARGLHGRSWGSARDQLIGMRWLLADGTMIRGGAGVVKNVAGYDLCKLAVGARGTLGVLTELTLRVSPVPAHRATMLLGYRRLEAAAEVLEALDAEPLGLSCLLLARSGPDWPHPYGEAPWWVIAGAEGSLEAVAWQREELQAAARETLAGPVRSLDDGEAGAFMAWLLATRDAPHPAALRLGLLPDQLGPALELMEAVAAGRDFECVAEAAGGLAWLWWPRGAPVSLIEEILRLAEDLGGHWLLERADLSLRDHPWAGPPRSDLPLQRALRLALDPKEVLSPGRMGPAC